MLSNMTKSIKALLLLFFIITTNFVGVSFNCELQENFKKNTLVSNLLIFGIIYFSINLSSYNTINDPVAIFKYSIWIYILFLLLIKQTFITFVINIVLICVIYILTIQIENEKSLGIQNPESYYQYYIDYFEMILFITLCIGFFHKFNNEQIEKPDINLVDYIFKMNYCK